MFSDDLKNLLAKRYAPPEWATLFEVNDGVGWTAKRRLDAVAFNLWATRGLRVLGFEIKVDRRDWLRELKQPAKAEAAGSVVDRFYLVTPPDVIELEELPLKWGWYEVKGGKFFQRRAAEDFRTDGDRGFLDRAFAAALVAKARQEVADAERRGRERGVRDAEEYRTRRTEQHVVAQAKEESDLERINRLAGVDLRWLDDERLRAAGEWLRSRRDLTNDRDDLRRQIDGSLRMLQRWKQELEEPPR